MNCPAEILGLVARFRENYDHYKHPSYNETQVRREFVDPFFKALGWDIDNTQGAAEAYKPVIHEDSIKVGAATKAPDYSFRFGGIRKFFVETKKPSVNIKLDTDPAFQLRRYAWSAKLPLSILTDFEEFAVYDCRIKPHHTDKASVGRILYITFDEYEAKWDEIAGLFTEEAIRKGAFDRYAEINKKKRGTAEVDDAFLKDIEEWRCTLARNLARQNPDLSQRALNFAVQKTIDRIIFLRICEDRGIERYGTLQGTTTGKGIYPRLCELFRKADDRYNSGLFHFSKEKGRPETPDEWTLDLAIDDKVLKDIVRHLYYPDSPYEFSVISADILGQVYEQFLGKVIRLTKGHQAKVEDKPEVKKAGGVYYTPKYIVDYIVANTVGKLIADKQPHEVAGRTKGNWKPAKGQRPLSVLDPACGSGSFLMGAYQYLLDWFRDQYVADKPEKLTDRVYRVGDQWRLTTAERKRILLDHIFGVDIDTQAVEVTKLSLLLKVLEGENKETLDRQQKLFRERALPDLSSNIKCGNSLIGPDFYDNQQLDLFDEDERLRINVFDWNAEFAEIMRGGGFDAVIGNPPYGAELPAAAKSYLSRWKCRNNDTAALFVEHAVDLLCPNGKVGFIIPKPFTYASNWKKLQEIVVERLEVLIDCSKVWREVKLEQCIVVFAATISEQYRGGYRDASTITENGFHLKSTAAELQFLPSHVSAKEVEFAREIMMRTVSLSRYATNRRGAMMQKFVTNRGKYGVIGGKQIQRWSIVTDSPKRIAAADVSDTKAFIQPTSVLVQNIVAHIQNPIPHIKIIAALPTEAECENFLILDTVNQIDCRDAITAKVVCASLNSSLINWFAYRFLFANAIRTMHFDAVTTNRMPMPPTLDTNLKSEIAAKVDRRKSQSESIGSIRTPQEQTALQRQIDATDRQIDQLVYQLYGLTDDEIRIVEEATQ